MNGIELIHYSGKAQEGDSLDGFDVNYPDAAGALRVFFRDLDFNGCIGGGSHCDRPTKANGPAKSSPRVKPGSRITVSSLPVSRSTAARLPFPDSHSHNRSR